MVARKARQPDAYASAIAKLLEPPAATLSGVTDVLITGGTGFIGRHLVERLLARGLGGSPVRIHLLVRDPSSFIDNADPRILPLLGDLSDLPTHRARLQSVRFVFHCAAEVKFTRGIDLERNNLDGTRSILAALRGIPIERFVHLSTIGAVDRTPGDPCSHPLTEDALPNPLSRYGRTKLAAEVLVRESGLPHTIVRVPWCYGPYMTPDTHVRALFEAVLRGKLYTWFNFPGKVSVVPASDLVESLLLVASRREALGETYFVADPEPVALGTLFRTMGDLAGRRAGVISIPSVLVRVLRRLRPLLPLTVQNLTNDVLCCSPAKAMKLGFRPSVLRREGLYRLAADLGVRRLPEERRPVSLVTGAARGIGRAIASELAARKHRLLLLDRDEKELEQTARGLGAIALPLDLSRSQALEQLAQFLSKENLHLDWVVNNAGIGAAGDTATLPQARLEAILNVNCSALTSLSRLALDHFHDGAGGTLVNIASSAAFQPLPRMAVYAASKAYVWSFSLALGEEVAQSHLGRVTTVAPSGTSTDFQRAAGVRTPAGERLMSPENVAGKIVTGAEEGRRTLILGRSAQAMFLLARLLPIRAQTVLWRRLMAARR
jgi:short-subunit dehydrogenase